MYDKLLYEAYGYSLNETDKDIRSLERAFHATGDAEDAAALLAALTRVNTRGPSYYKALWAVGQRPSNSDIQTRAMALVDAMDTLVIGLYNALNVVDYADVLNELLRASNNTHSVHNGYHARTNVAIARPHHFDKQHFAYVDKYVTNTVSGAKKLKASKTSVDDVVKALAELMELAGN